MERSRTALAARRFALEADLLLSRRGRRYIADVKFGRLAAALDHGPTRRQLLEYALAYDVEGVLLVDMGSERIHEVKFGVLDRTMAPRFGWSSALAAAGIGAVVTLAAVSCLRF